jgi:hypothetical protein
MSENVEVAIVADQETERIDFKEYLDTTSKGDWCEVIKDIVAMANSGGGVLIIGVKDDGQASGKDVAAIIDYDPAKVTDKIFSYTGRHFSEFRIHSAQKDGYTIAAIEVGRVPVPLVFTAPGNYQGHDGKAKCAFTIGTVYFRHGAKSEPCTSDDLHQFLQREIEIVRVSWLDGIRKVVEAPEGASIVVVPASETMAVPNRLQAVRLVDDLDAPPHRLLDPNETHPYRQIDVVRLLNECLKVKRPINTHDILSVRWAHNISDIPRFYYKPQHSSPQYSPEFIDWLAERYSEDESFFDNAKARYHEITRERNKSWRKGR